MERGPAEPLKDGESARPPQEEALPRQFGKYTLMRRLAAGGMAELFLALHRPFAGFEKLVVIKRILPAMNSDKGFIEMLLHEARIAATLSHPNIVQIFDVGQVDGKFFIAMEHVHGEDIRSIVRAMKKKNIAELPLEHTLSIVTGMCAGLAYAHEKRDLDGALLQIVHRDISPQNIVVTFTGDVKIVDFGVAKSSVQGLEETRDGRVKGKLPYMSPEQASGEQVDGRTDIFAAGVILFELTTGRRLFKGANDRETLELICEQDYPLPSEVCPGYSPALERIVMKALAKERGARYQSAREMQSDLERVIREEQIPASQVSLTHWMQSLFEEKLSQQSEALLEWKQLADGVAAQQRAGSAHDGTLTNGTGMARGSLVAEAPARPGLRRRWVAGAAVVAAGAFALLAMKLQPGQETARQEEVAAAAMAPEQREPAAEAKGWLEISSQPAGCAIWIDGDLRKETTPARVENLPLDREIRVKITREGLEPYGETVTLDAERPSRSVSAAMKAGSVTVVLRVEPEPVVWLDGKPWSGDPGRLESLSAGEEHTLILAATGYTTRTVTFVAEPGETRIIREKLRKSEPARDRAAPGGDRAAPGGGSASVRASAKGGSCRVIVNGEPVGATPVEAPVRPGTVRVSCVPQRGPSQSRAIKVAAGETARVSFKLD
ncbi:serine/threonine protein kinase [Sorangium sp. So ce1099]|uniref:serine/threonine protein kinase n=1 Tax=Sorangium sp. So ce1099 TaxID=3133331 RepID=UPI003F5FE71F